MSRIDVLGLAVGVSGLLMFAVLWGMLAVVACHG